MRCTKMVNVALALSANFAVVQSVQAGITRDWINATGGFYSTDSNWDPPSSPESDDSARFNLNDAYTVTFTGNRNTGRFILANDKVVLDLSGGGAPAEGWTWGLKSITAPSILFGLNEEDVARCTIRDGTLRGINASIGFAAGSTGNLTINTGAQLKLLGAPDPDGDGIIANTGLLIVGASGTGGVTVTGGGKVTSIGGRIGVNAGSRGTVTVSSEEASWIMTDDLRIGGKTSGTGLLTVRGGATVDIGDTLDVRKKGTVRLNGGTLTTGTFKNLGTFDFLKGTLNVTKSNLILGAAGPLGPITELNPDKTINVTLDATLNLDAQLILDDGHFTAAHTENLGKIIFNGTDALLTTLTLVNRGDVSGRGTLDGDLDNRSSGEVAVDGGDRLTITGGGDNSGLIKLTGGSIIEFSKPVVNRAGGTIRAGGTLFFAQGLTNDGQMIFDSGFSVVDGDVINSPGGQITVTGPGATFNNSVEHNGAPIFVGPDSVLTFNGDVRGAGNFTGGGFIDFEADYRPGPPTVEIRFDNDVVFGAAAVLHLKLGGLIPGDGYDHIISSRQIVLNDVDVVLLPGFSPPLGARFEVVTADTIVYTGDISVPVLGNGLIFDVEEGEQALVLTVVAIPEPGVFLLMATTLGVATLRRRRA